MNKNIESIVFTRPRPAMNKNIESIVFIEPTWVGETHSQINAEMINIIMRAFPGVPASFLAEEGHQSGVKRELAGLRQPNFRTIKISNRFFGKTGLVSWRRMFAEAIAFLRAIPCRTNGHVLLVVLSANSTALWLAEAFAKLFGDRLLVHVVLHGNLNDINGWRTRNPLARLFDLPSVLSSRPPSNLRFIVLEAGIKYELVARMPHLAYSCDVLPHPLQENLAWIIENPDHVDTNTPIRFGLIGQGTKAKGLDCFTETALSILSDYAGRANFTIAGAVHDPKMRNEVESLPCKMNTDWPDADEYARRISALHYAVLPLSPSYYSLSASGAVADALSFGKPIITTDVPATRQLFRDFPGIGYLCSHPKDIAGVMRRLLNGEFSQVYQKQVASVMEARKSRDPKKLSARYRSLIFPAFLGF